MKLFLLIEERKRLHKNPKKINWQHLSITTTPRSVVLSEGRGQDRSGEKSTLLICVGINAISSFEGVKLSN